MGRCKMKLQLNLIEIKVSRELDHSVYSLSNIEKPKLLYFVLINQSRKEEVSTIFKK